MESNCTISREFPKLHATTSSNETDRNPGTTSVSVSNSFQNGAATVVNSSGSENNTNTRTSSVTYLQNPSLTNHHSSRSPPPTYDAVLLSKANPPTYDEATNRIPERDRDNSLTIPSELEAEVDNQLDSYGTCDCSSCQGQYTYQEEHDIVFPMETHVLMQEVLADGMAFCSLM